jgi:hypothetical protein
MTQQPVEGQGLIVTGASQSHSDTTLGRTPLDEWSARCRDLYITWHHTTLRTALFWTVTQRVVAIPYRRFGTTCRYHLKRSRIQFTVRCIMIQKSGESMKSNTRHSRDTSMLPAAFEPERPWTHALDQTTAGIGPTLDIPQQIVVNKLALHRVLAVCVCVYIHTHTYIYIYIYTDTLCMYKKSCNSNIWLMST